MESSFVSLLCVPFFSRLAGGSVLHELHTRCGGEDGEAEARHPAPTGGQSGKQNEYMQVCVLFALRLAPRSRSRMAPSPPSVSAPPGGDERIYSHTGAVKLLQ